MAANSIESGQLLESRVCRIEEVPDGMGRAFEMAGKSIAVFRTRAGETRAVENRCPHKGGPLADGIVAGSQIVCPMHARRYSLETGECDDASVCGVSAFSTRVEAGWVLVSLSAANPSSAD